MPDGDRPHIAPCAAASPPRSAPRGLSPLRRDLGVAANLDERIRQAPTTECCWSLAAVPIDQMVEPVTEGDHLGLVTDLAAVLRRSVARDAVPFTRSSDSGARGCKDAEMAEFLRD